MHDSVLNWATTMVDVHRLNNLFKVLEIGSQDFNGSIRSLFGNARLYVGTDMQEGPGVDVVCDAHDLTVTPEIYNNEPFDVVVCTEMLEHDAKFWLTLQQIKDVLKPNGWLILTARGCTRGSTGVNGQSMFEHGYPNDYYRFMPESVPLLLALAGCEVVDLQEDHQHPGFMALGRRSY